MVSAATLKQTQPTLNGATKKGKTMSRFGAKTKSKIPTKTVADVPDGAGVDNPARRRALDQALSQIDKAFGSGSIMKLDDDPSKILPGISTGAISLDLALGGRGIPKGRVVEIFGPESSGKTTLCLHLIASAQKEGGMAAFIDAEHALDVTYAKNIGVQADRLLIAQPDHGEQALEITDTLVRSGAVDVLMPLLDVERKLRQRPTIKTIQPQRHAASVTVPSLFVHGDRDDYVLPEQGRQLYNSVTHHNKLWITVPDARHSNVLATSMPLYSEMSAWLLSQFSQLPER